MVEQISGAREGHIHKLQILHNVYYEHKRGLSFVIITMTRISKQDKSNKITPVDIFVPLTTHYHTLLTYDTKMVNCIVTSKAVIFILKSMHIVYRPT